MTTDMSQVSEVEDVATKPIYHVLLTEGIQTFLESNAQVLLVQGDAGTGKSIFLK